MHIIPFKIVINYFILLLRGIIRDGCVENNIFIVHLNLIWPITRYSHHPDLVDPGYIYLRGDSIGGGVDWFYLMDVLSAYKHLSYKCWYRTGKAATYL